MYAKTADVKVSYFLLLHIYDIGIKVLDIWSVSLLSVIFNMKVHFLNIINYFS